MGLSDPVGIFQSKASPAQMSTSRLWLLYVWTWRNSTNPGQLVQQTPCSLEPGFLGGILLIQADHTNPTLCLRIAPAHSSSKPTWHERMLPLSGADSLGAVRPSSLHMQSRGSLLPSLDLHRKTWPLLSSLWHGGPCPGWKAWESRAPRNTSGSADILLLDPSPHPSLIGPP